MVGLLAVHVQTPLFIRKRGDSELEFGFQFSNEFMDHLTQLSLIPAIEILATLIYDLPAGCVERQPVCTG